MHGARLVDEATAVEVIYRSGRPPQGIVARNERIEADEIDEIAGLPVTTPARTALDLARHHRVGKPEGRRVPDACSSGRARIPAVEATPTLARLVGVGDLW